MFFLRTVYPIRLLPQRLSKIQLRHMTRPWRILGDLNSSSANEESSQPNKIDSDCVVILAALLCALISVLGLVAVARCTWLRRISGGSSSRTGTGNSAGPRTTASANKGLKKKILRSLPKLVLTSESACKFSDCAICLSELAIGDEIRVLPQCGHGFHVSCIDKWLESHSSCPSCRQLLNMTRCDKCGSFPAVTRTASAAASSSSTGSQSETAFKKREDHTDRFLP